jgi:site-specific DNA recombinase
MEYAAPSTLSTLIVERPSVQTMALRRAQRGLPHSGAMRPFGFDDDKITLRPNEANVIREVAERFLAGESLRSLTVWMNLHGPAPVRGTSWRTPTLAAILKSPRIAGLREHRGAVVGLAVWPEIISASERDRLLATFETRHVVGRRAPSKSPLSGLLRCGKCGAVMYSVTRRSLRKYVCVSGPDHRGCGRLSIAAEPVETELRRALADHRNQPVDADSVADPRAFHLFLDHVVIDAGRPGRTFDPSRVRPTFMSPAA